uniref:ODAD1 central coiled coil region domain-containing protein n=1 Tax=Cyanoderma ruficeps TaxID=181631 RepID=A0A8C3NUP3_9PASS
TLPCLWQRREASADPELSAEEKERRARMEIRGKDLPWQMGCAKCHLLFHFYRKAIDDLKQEHRHVTLMLSQIYSPSNVVLENRRRMKLQSLLQARMQNDALIKERKALLADLVKQVRMEKKIVKQRDTNWRMLEAKSHKHLEKKIHFLEMNLNHITVRYNTIMTRNNKLQEETVSLQLQKAIYDNSYWKLERSLVQQNKLLNDAIEEATEDYEQWMEDLGRISDIRDVRYRETIQYNIRLLERKCALHQETRLKNFFLAKSLQGRLCKGQPWLSVPFSAFEAAERAKLSQKESYEVAYRRLLELSDGDIDEFLEDFIEKDRRFFILFGYAIRLNVRNEGLRQRIQAIEVSRIRGMQRSSQICAKNSAVFSRAKPEISKEANKYENKYKESSKLLGQILSRVQTLLKDLDCDITKMVKPLGDSLVAVFGPVEDKMKEFLLRESLLRYTSVDRTQRSQAFISPLQGASSLLGAMDRGKLCPPPPDLETTDPKIGEQGVGRNGLKPFPSPPVAAWSTPAAHVSFPVHPLQPVLPRWGGMRPVKLCIMGWTFSWAAEEPLGRAQLRQLVIQRHKQELSSPPSSAKKRRRLTSRSSAGTKSPSGTPSPPRTKSPPETGTD